MSTDHHPRLQTARHPVQCGLSVNPHSAALTAYWDDTDWTPVRKTIGKAVAAPNQAQTLHKGIMNRAWLFELTVRKPTDRLACWNPLSMTSGAAPHEVTAAVVDAFATSLGWGTPTRPALSRS
ncbi:hypothetical protein ACFV3E_42335 [Streptomyces sp. NPDC059718]